jgi:fructokinase
MIGLAIDDRKFSAAILADGGDFISHIECPTPAGGYRDWLITIRDLVARLDGASPQMPVAVAVPAIILADRVEITPLAHLSGSDLRRDLQSTLSRDVSLAGFGDALAAFHAHDSAGESKGPLVALWIGSSCHGGLAANGKIVTGAHGAAGNWAHLQLPAPVPHELDGRPCWCGRNGCLETFLSTTGLEEDYERVTGDKRTAAQIAAATDGNDIVAESVIQVFEDRLGRATASMISLIDPGTIILGGETPLPKRMCERVPRKWPGYVQIDRSNTHLTFCERGHEALIGGAAVLAARRGA